MTDLDFQIKKFRIDKKMSLKIKTSGKYKIKSSMDLYMGLYFNPKDDS